MDDDSHLLTLWREAGSKAVHARFADVESKALAVSLVHHEVPEPVVAAVRRSRPDGYWAMATFLANPDRDVGDDDLVMCWLALGTVAGHPAARDYFLAGVLRMVLRDQGEEGPGMAGPFADWLRRAAHWRRRIPDRTRRTALEELVDHEPPAAPAGTEDNAGAPEDDGRTEGRHRVMTRFGDVGSHEGKRLEGRYGALLGPLDLTPMPDPDALEDRLAEEFAWMTDVVVAVGNQLRLSRSLGRPWFGLRPMLLVGPPGCGKTQFARRLAELAGTACQLINAGGSCDNRALTGTARGWASTQPGQPLILMAETGTANPLIVIDEIDKASTNDRNGRVQDTLLALLEPGTAASWFDESLLAPADLSRVSWVLTANRLAGLPEPLLSRLHVVEVAAPDPEAHFDSLLESLGRALARDYDVDARMLPKLPGDAERLLRRAFAECRDIRLLKKGFLRLIEGEAAMAHQAVH